MTRSIKKGPFIKKNLLKKNIILRSKKFKLILKTWTRASTILPFLIQNIFAIHNGNKFIPLIIKEQMIGYKLGEFAPTKKFFAHTIKNEKKIKHKKK